VLTGKLRLKEAEIFAGAQTATAAEEVELTPADLQQLAQRFGPSAAAGAEEGPGFLDRFRMNVDLSFPGRVWFRKAQSPSMDVEVAGRINLRQEPGDEMRFFGQVEPIPDRGELNLYGRTFRLSEGEIALRGPADSTTLNVTAQYRVPTEGDPDAEEVVINVHATGRPDSLGLEFEADPDMGQEDIVSYIVTGRPASDNPLVDQQGGGTNATQVAIGQLAGTLGTAAGEELGFDVFTIRQEPEQGLTLTAGRYLGSRVFVSLHQPLRIGTSTASQQTSESSGPGFELEYAWRRWLRSTMRGGSLPASLLMRGRHAF
jgi:autotransporter translocation and assembly factor TamB